MLRMLFAGALLLALLPASTQAQHKLKLPSSILPDGLGVNIHFTDPRKGEMKMLSEAGFTWVRMDYAWEGIEKSKGKYDFSAYDRLMVALKPYGIRPIFILDYSNRFYDDGQSPRSDDGRNAMAEWAAASVRHFKGQGILWEMYNEPNIGFWNPKPNTADYVKMALTVGKAIKAAEPDETYVGPATSGMDMRFLEECFKAGLLEYWSAVTVHPYRSADPETAAADFARLRNLIARYAPKGKTIPIISGEWGYSSGWSGMTEERQGKLLPRELLTNVSNNIVLSIWYDWHDDGLDPKEPEHHFGTTHNPYLAGDPVYEPKPAYLAAKTLTSFLRGYRFNKRLAVGQNNVYVLLFNKGKSVRLAAWTTSREPVAVHLPCSPGTVRVLSHLGQNLSNLSAGNDGLELSLTDAPIYLEPEASNDLLNIWAQWQTLPEYASAKGDGEYTVVATLRNPLAKAIRVNGVFEGKRSGETVASATIPPGGKIKAVGRIHLSRQAGPFPLTLKVEIEGIGAIDQDINVDVSNPLNIVSMPVVGDTLLLRVENPSGDPVACTLTVGPTRGMELPAVSQPLSMGKEVRETTISFHITSCSDLYSYGVAVKDNSGNTVYKAPAVAFRPLDNFAKYESGLKPKTYDIFPDGDAKVPSEQTLVCSLPTDGPPVKGAGALKIEYKFHKGWKFLDVKPATQAMQAIPGSEDAATAPKAFGIWIYGDGNGCSPRLRFVDSKGQTFQPSADSIDWKGWRYVSMPMDGSQSGHWGGPDDGVVRYPIHWDTMFLLDNSSANELKGAVYISSPTLIYADAED